MKKLFLHVLFSLSILAIIPALLNAADDNLKYYPRALTKKITIINKTSYDIYIKSECPYIAVMLPFTYQYSKGYRVVQNTTGFYSSISKNSEKVIALSATSRKPHLSDGEIHLVTELYNYGTHFEVDDNRPQDHSTIDKSDKIEIKDNATYLVELDDSNKKFVVTKVDSLFPKK